MWAGLRGAENGETLWRYSCLATAGGCLLLLGLEVKVNQLEPAFMCWGVYLALSRAWLIMQPRHTISLTLLLGACHWLPSGEPQPKPEGKDIRGWVSQRLASRGGQFVKNEVWGGDSVGRTIWSLKPSWVTEWVVAGQWRSHRESPSNPSTEREEGDSTSWPAWRTVTLSTYWLLHCPLLNNLRCPGTAIYFKSFPLGFWKELKSFYLIRRVLPII